MNCPDCHERLQQWLDARSPGPPPALCASCADWAASALRLDRGLRLLALPTPPPRLTDRIVARAAPERRFRRYRVLFAAGVAAAAAMLLVAAWEGLHGGGRPAPRTEPPPLVTTADPTPVALRDSVAEAGAAVASLTTRTADETVEKTRILLPVVDPALTTLNLPRSIDPPASLRGAGEGASSGLEPVADSARRAVSLLFRELPPMDPNAKNGF